MRALRHPALGLVLVVLALQALPQQLGMLSTMLVVDDGVIDAKILSLVGAQLAVSVLELATGWAIMRRRAAGGWFAGYFGAGVLLSIAAALLVRNQEAGLGVALGSAVETLGFPVLIAVASMLHSGDELDDRRRIRDAAAILLVIAVRALLFTPLDVTRQAQMIGVAHGTVGTYVGFLIWPAIGLAVAALALVAAVRLMRDPHERGWRALRVYVVAAIAVQLALALLSIGWTLFDDYGPNGDRIKLQVISTRVVGLVGVLVPLAIWSYMRAALADETAENEPQRPSLAPLWIALTFVPTLAARPFVAGTLMAPLGGRTTGLVVVLAIGCASAILGAAYTAARGTVFARWWTIGAALAGTAILAAGALYVFRSGNRFISMGTIAPIGNLAAATVAAAWLHRRAA